MKQYMKLIQIIFQILYDGRTKMYPKYILALCIFTFITNSVLGIPNIFVKFLENEIEIG